MPVPASSSPSPQGPSDGGGKYVYGPLPSTTDYIRLITLLPVELSITVEAHHTPFDAPLRGELTTAHLHSAPPFQALSYVWGSPDSERRVLYVKDAETSQRWNRLDITSSLDVALRHLRRPSRTVLLWVDQICIDQSGNIPEKNAQVSIMGSIYGRASEVLVWLGEAGDGSAELIQRMANGAKLARKTGIDFYSPQNSPTLEGIFELMSMATGRLGLRGTDESGLFSRLGEMASEIPIASEGDKRATAAQLRAFFKRKWFTRVWVLQEYILAKNAVLVCGHTTIDSQEFLRARTIMTFMCMCSKGMKQSQIDATDDLQTALGQDPLTEIPRLGRERRSLCTLLRDLYCTERNSGDPRDRIFALLALSEDADSLGIVPDYSEGLTAHQLFTDVARAILTSNCRDLSLLEIAQFPKTIAGDENLGDKLPSWVPDFYRPHESFSRPAREIDSGEWLYAPTGDLRNSWIFPTNDSLVFGVEGICVDEIEVVGEPWLGGNVEGKEGGTTPFPRYLQYFAEVEKLCALSLSKLETHESSDSGAADPIWAERKERRREAPWRIMLGDVTAGSNLRLGRATPETVGNLQKLLQAEEALETMRILIANLSGGLLSFSNREIHGNIEWPGCSTGAMAAFRAVVVVLIKFLFGVMLSFLECILKGYVDKGNQLIFRMGAIEANERLWGTSTGPWAQFLELEESTYQLLMREVVALASRLEHLRNKAPFLTWRKGYVGMGPLQLQKGDIIVVLFGSRVPYALRPCGEPCRKRFKLLGEAYCDGVMDGELLGHPTEPFYLV